LYVVPEETRVTTQERHTGSNGEERGTKECGRVDWIQKKKARAR